MPRVTTVKSARKPQGECGKCGAKIKKGETYRWWKFRYGGRYVRCAKPDCAPRASDLTQSTFYSQLYSIQDSLSDAVDARSPDDLRAAADELRSLGEEMSSNRDNMPESLQDSDTGELLQTRADECESRSSEIESIADDLEDQPDPDDWQQYAEDEGIERDGDESDEDFEARVRDKIQEEVDAAWEQVDIDLSID
jgi:hypothetical protein